MSGCISYGPSTVRDAVTTLTVDRQADLFLDTLPYNAHTTASDALWASLPVLTRQGRAFQARVGASLLKAIGLPELITETLADYEARAVEIARDPALLAGLCRRPLSQGEGGARATPMRATSTGERGVAMRSSDGPRSNFMARNTCPSASPAA